MKKVLSVLVNANKQIKPKANYYNRLEIDEFWSYVGSKKNKVWLIYAYHRQTCKIVSYVFGKGNYKTAKKLRQKLSDLGINFYSIFTDDWSSFIKVFKSCYI